MVRLADHSIPIKSLRRKLQERKVSLSRLKARRQAIQKEMDLIDSQIGEALGSKSQAADLPPGWDQSNRRRVELIDKELNGSLTSAEQQELEDLRRLMSAALDKFAPLPPRTSRGIPGQAAKAG